MPMMDNLHTELQPTIFISYAHENETFEVSVKAFADWLRDHQCNVLTDHQYSHRPPTEGWQRWMRNCIDNADIVLIVCTPMVKDHFEMSSETFRGKGIAYESTIVTQQIYDDFMLNTKFFPILPDDGDETNLPTTLKPWWNGHRFPTGNDGILKLIHESTTSSADKSGNQQPSNQSTKRIIQDEQKCYLLITSYNDYLGRIVEAWNRDKDLRSFSKHFEPQERSYTSVRPETLTR